ncbi:MAG: zinc transporter ZupT [Spirochaetes bacterium]|nr:zinc transporter ZupT [Spirochaetota bacterium]
MPASPFLTALLYTVLAGLATGIGSLIALVSKRATPRFLSLSLGFSAGVMVFVSLVELFNDARTHLAMVWGTRGGYWGAIVGFFAGFALIAAIDRLVPPAVNPHEARAREAAAHEAVDSRACDDGPDDRRGAKLLRTGMLTAFVIALHNLPEGVATLFAALEDPRLGGAIAIAIAIHNIPEGIAISVPVYYATGSRRRAFWYSFASGLSEPLGAVIGYLLLRPLLGGPTFGLILAAVAGIMIYISLDELLPSAREYGENHLEMAGLAAGMAIMAVSLALSGR